MPAAPPRFTLSPFNENGDGGYYQQHNQQHPRHTNHKRPTATDFAASRSRRNTHPTGPHDTAPPLGGVHGVDDPVLSSRRALAGAKLPASDLHNINQLFAFLAALVGLLLAVALVQSGVNSKPVAALIKLPGDLFLNVLLCVVVPTIFLNSVLASMHFWTLNKAKALFYKLFAYFLLSTLWAAVLGVLVGVAAASASLFQPHTPPLSRASNAVAVGKAAITLRCPSSLNASLALGDDGAFRCTATTTTNGTAFLLQDLSGSFRLRDDPRNVKSLGDAVVLLLECFFPANAAQAFLNGDVMSVLLMGAALGIALIHKSTVRTREQLTTPGFQTPGGFEAADNSSALSGQLFLLVMQGEVMLSVVLRALLKVLPFALVALVAGNILVGHTIAPGDRAPSVQDLAMLGGVVIVALLLQLASLMALTGFLTRTNPFTYAKHLLPAQLVAMASSSSLFALPSTVRSIAASKQVSMPLAHFVCSSGLALNKNGSALYLSIASIYVLVASGARDVATQPANLLLLIFVSMLCSCVIPPMPHGNLAFVSTILWSVFGIHDTARLAQMVVLLAAMDYLLDPFVTAVNVTSNSLIALILAVQMDETFIEFGRFDAVSDTQEEDSNDGFPLDENDRAFGSHPHAGGPRRGPQAHENYQDYHTPTQRDRAGTHGSGTMRPPMAARMSSVGESVVSV